MPIFTPHFSTFHAKRYIFYVQLEHILTNSDAALLSQCCIWEQNSLDDWFLPWPPKNLSSVSRRILYLQKGMRFKAWLYFLLMKSRIASILFREKYISLYFSYQYSLKKAFINIYQYMCVFAISLAWQKACMFCISRCIYSTRKKTV